MFAKKPLASAIGIASAAGALSAVMAAPVAYAAEGDQVIEEVVVTGSRIAKKDFISNAPVTTVGQEQFQLTNAVNTESLLNTLPQAVPGLDRTSNNPGNGTATVDLRGLGSNRTLVLMNGTRVNPTTSVGTVDINSIPTALIENVEVLTGGASAVYGSDAVAGVVNFIIKDDFEGVAIDAGYEITEEGDAGLFSTNFTVGGNFADGRGNVAFSLNYTDRESLFQGDRGFSTFAQTEGTDADGNLILENGGSSGVPQGAIFNGGFGPVADGGTGFSPDSVAVIFGQDGSIRPFIDGGDNNDFYNYAPVNFIQLPQERYQASVFGHYAINDNIEAFGRALYTSSTVPAQLAPTPIFQTASFTLDGSPFLTPEAQQVLSDAIGEGVDTDGNGIDDTGSALLRRRLEEVGPRVSDDRFESWSIQAGFRGEAGAWNWDTYVQVGQVENSTVQLGNVNRDRFDQALLLDLSDPTGGTCADPSSNGATVGCAPLNIFGEGNISEASAAFLRTAVASTSVFEQTIVGANLSASEGLFELPGGDVGIAVGYEYIDNDFVFTPSQDLAAGTIAGFAGAPLTEGAFDVHQVYAEVYLPLLSGRRGVEELSLELAGRYSDYSTVGDVGNYKVSLSYAPIQQLRFRAGWNTAVRAPSIGELFAPQGENFPGATDPCSANGNPDAAVAAICEATGVPANLVGSPALNLAASQVRTLQGGNPDLQEEEAETFTVGFVVTPTDSLSISVDYFDIEIDDFIFAFGGGANQVLSTCFSATDPLGGAGSPFCDVVNRRTDGTIDFVSITSQNVARQTLKGIDLQLEYSQELAGGLFGVNYIGTFTTESEFTPFAGAEPIQCDGRFGDLQCDDPLPEYKHRATVSWSKDRFTGQLLWRLVGEVEDDDDSPTGEFFTEEIDAEHYFDLTGAYDFGNGFSATLGIDNIFDNQPPILGDNQEQANTYPATYDVFGRTYFLRVGAQF